MIQLQIVGGLRAGDLFVPKQLPLRIGRGPTDDLRLEDDGVWAGHACIELTPDGFFHLKAREEAWVCVDGARMRDTRIKGGDVLDLGAAKMIFQLASAPQRGLALREWFLWINLLVLAVSEMILMFWLG